MEILINTLIDYWFWLALAMSLFWGVRSVNLFAKTRNGWWKCYQFLFNFIGSFAGWSCFYILLIRAKNKLPDFQILTIGDIVLFIFSLLGLTGHLPETIYGFVKGFSEIGNKILSKSLGEK